MKKSADVFSEFIVGIFMLAVMALLVYFTIVISGVDIFRGREKVTATAVFSDVGGLKERDNVMYRGMKVGTVERIDLDRNGARVVMNIDDDVVMRETGKVSVESLSLLGGNYLLMEEGKGEVVSVTETVFEGERPMDWMRDLGSIARNLNELTSGGELKSIVSNVDAAVVSVRKVVDRVERGEGTLGKLLGPDETVYDDIKSMMASLKEVSSRLERGEGTLGKLLSSDQTVYDDLKKTMANASTLTERLASVSDRLERGEGLLGKLLTDDDGGLSSDVRAAIADIRGFTGKLNEGEGLLARLASDKDLADDASRLVSGLAAVATRLEKGEGTLGRLTTDEALYEDLTGLVKDIRQIVDNYRDTAPITTFGSLMMGGL